MGTVYRARDRVLERIVAVKLLHGGRAQDPGPERLSSRFLNEARAVARLNHPTIVSVYDFSDTDPAGDYFAMEYVEGCTIEDYVRLGPEARLRHSFSLMDQLLTGLAYAHARGVIHRDVKPSNLLVTRDGRIKITDFGIAKVGSTKQTKTGTMMGTPAYMAPERYGGGEVDQRCDIYSAGVVFFELLAGRRPFNGPLHEIMYQICHVAPARVSSLEPALPAALDPLLARVLHKDPAARFQTADDFAAAIAALGAQLGIPITPSARPPAVAAAPTVHVFPTDAAAPGVPASAGPAGWSTVQLAAIEQQLTPIMGPMARILVKRAAVRAQDVEHLYEEIARQLRSEDERRRFLATAPKMTAPDPAVPPAAQLPEPRDEPVGAAPNGAVAAATLQRTERILLRYVGPIARVLVKKTAALALSETDLYGRLAERINDGRERARFLAEINQS
jgi:serine/threonine-protein kinase